MSSPRRCICIHGHFYQPPRENAWLEAIEVQDSAAPFHDWNQRINHECYAANGRSRILNHENKIVRILNNYARMSFNFGPTLLAWMELAAPLTYHRILDADRASAKRFSGHGSAIAQAYNHIILPLAATQDRITQIVWGIADFEHRFGRKPEGMWLPETAVDLETLDLLAQQGIRFTILAPHQCARVRPIATEQDPEAPLWHETPDATVDTTQPYRVKTGSDRSIAVFFYNGPVSRAIAFEGLLNNGGMLARRLMLPQPENNRQAQLTHAATDGESYGHHHPHGDMALAYALQLMEEDADVHLTNYGEFLANFPPTSEAEIAENTSWSCAHGVGRWQADCGCAIGGNAGWNQQWRAPLRAALNWLRDAVRPQWTQAAQQYLADPTAAIHDYIHVLLHRTPESQQQFLLRHCTETLLPETQIAVLQLMELERHLQLMFTSCGWFFDDLAGIETVQIISYAGRVLQLASVLFPESGAALEAEFLVRLAEARSNAAPQETGAEIYRRAMLSQKIDLPQIAAQYAITSLFEAPADQTTEYCYEVRRTAHEMIPSGRGSFSWGHADIRSQITGETLSADYAVLHLGDQNLSAAVQPVSPSQATDFQKLAERIRQASGRADLAETLRLFVHEFPSSYSLRSLFRDDQRRILKILLDSTLSEMEGMLRTIYEDHLSLLRYLSLTGMPKPQSLMLAAQFSLSTQLRKLLTEDPFDAAAIRRLAAQTSADQVALDAVDLAYLANQRMLRAMRQVEQQPEDAESLKLALEILETLRTLPFEIDLWETQNRWYQVWRQNHLEESNRKAHDQPCHEELRELGFRLNIEVDQLVVDI
jgi:alpha-amylase/alpha-mannosidase (GH57 family)